ncbi:hypothetical protein NA647_00140 [Pseudomonas stutzeri]|uniref:hypothetical protein n=1 Tax=Stutzerimonas stutzeri TaxID=316 RepID=UPI00210A2E2F|nr:hypothetical protein [Stutzerimonas stutzeri]MCQ4285849.1 hypothetical protein [Stutzerimonas stutzeri]
MEHIINWTNENSGFLALVLFLATLFLGWISGVFKALKRKPELKIEVLQGPTFCASFDTSRTWNGHKTHRTAISLYLSITNIGSAPTDIKFIYVGYRSKNHSIPFRWFWLKEITVSKSDFVMKLGKDSKVFPFLMQRNQLTNNQIDTYLLEGKRCNGVVYFEQDESWGDYLPKTRNNRMTIKIKVFDVYGNHYSTKTVINKVTLDAAKEVSEKFGETRESLVGV